MDDTTIAVLSQRISNTTKRKSLHPTWGRPMKCVGDALFCRTNPSTHNAPVFKERCKDASIDTVHKDENYLWNVYYIYFIYLFISNNFIFNERCLLTRFFIRGREKGPTDTLNHLESLKSLLAIKLSLYCGFLWFWWFWWFFSWWKVATNRRFFQGVALDCRAGDGLTSI